MKERFIKTDDGVKLFCRIAGKGHPLLLIHGAMVDADFFDEVQEFLSKEYRVITYDRRGYSRSTPGDDYRIERQAQDAAAILKKLTNKKAIVVGCSAGAMIALKLQELYPELVSRLFLHEPPIITLDGVYNETIETWLNGIYDKLSRGKIRQAVVDFVLLNTGDANVNSKPLTPVQVQQQLDNGKIFIEKEFPEVFDRDKQPFDYAALKNKNRITVLVGDSSGDTYAANAGNALAELLGTPICYVPGAHNGARDLPLEFSSTLIGLLRLI